MDETEEQEEALQPLCLDNKSILWQLETTLREMCVSRPDKGSERSRQYAIAITEMEKTVAYFKVFVIGKTLPSITDQSCKCLRCDWHGIVLDCENDTDGNLTCPECLADAIEI